jgi:phospholipid/cholesterol/gamma-HCH transport system ATP-binding protein
MGEGAHIEFEAVEMGFGGRTVFRNLSCAMPRGRITVILGGSGSGKSTMLRLIGGLVQPRAGQIRVDGRDVTRLSERQLYEVRRDLGMLFQGGALLDSMSVFDNLAFPLREHTDLDEAAIANEVHDRLAAVGLRDVDDLLPSQLSGGMVKRVGLARAIIRRPSIVLADEPFSGLDPISTKRIENLLRRINSGHGITMVVVSHDIASTMRMADWIVLLQDGGAVQGTPAALRESPDRRVRAFLGEDVGDENGEDDAPALSGTA